MCCILMILYKSLLLGPLSQCCSKCSQRVLMYLLTSSAVFVCFYQRHVFYQYLEGIIDRRQSTGAPPANSNCPKMITTIQRRPEIPLKEYHSWNIDQIRGITHGFFVGYFISLIPGGVIADLFGAKISMATGVVMSTISTAVFPILADHGPSVLACGRFFQGISQGLVFPATSSVTAQWAPITERTIATGIIHSGASFGWTLGYMTELLHLEPALSWNFQFYVSCGLGLTWIIFWITFAFSKPSDCPYINDSELQRINLSFDKYTRKTAGMHRLIPWKEIVCSPPFLALIAINWGGIWLHYIMMHHFVYYLLNVNGITHDLSLHLLEFALFALGVSNVFWSFLSDCLVKHDYVSATMIRKLYPFISNLLMISCMMGMIFSDCMSLAVVSLYMAMCFLRGPFIISVRANVVDLNPHFAGTLNGIVYCTGCVVALFAWDSFSFVVRDTSDITQWRNMFLVISAVMVLFSLPYLWYGTANVQPWGGGGTQIVQDSFTIKRE